MDGSLQNCPFCGFHPQDEYDIMLHMEERHHEGGRSLFVPEDESRPASTAVTEEGSYVECPRCFEQVTLAEIDEHQEFHEAEEEGHSPQPVHEPIANAVANEYRSPYSNSSRDDVPEVVKKYGHKSADRSTPDAKNRQSGATDRWMNILKLPSVTKKREMSGSATSGQGPRKRLGKAELGRYAHEDVMPDWLVHLLNEKGQIMQGDIIPVLASLLEASRSTHHAYLCNQAVNHISKLKKEGGFCGYRNIQMLSSYIIGAQAEGSHHFNGQLPSIFDIQEYIENAWDLGINAQGRVETGGVRGSRKYIGTPEAQAMFLSLNIPCNAQGFKDQRPGNAESRLFQHVEQYFQDGDFDPTSKVRRTNLPPIYFQHRGHSLTIVGFEQKWSGEKELLVFDPMFHDSDAVIRLIGQRHPRISSPDSMLKLYRRGNKYLKRFYEFEILKLTSRPPVAGIEEDAKMDTYSSSGHKTRSGTLPS